MRRIVVAVDESPASGRAAAFVNAFFGHDDDVSIVAVNVARVPVEWLPPVAYGGLYPWPWGPQGGGVVPDEVIRETEDDATVVAAEQAPEGAEVEVVFGEPVDAIQRAAVEAHADLVVVGANHKGFFDRMLEGSVSERLTRESPLPVLVVP
jgi:nucleotide-binding universal stress UspA family protein